MSENSNSNSDSKMIVELSFWCCVGAAGAFLLVIARFLFYFFEYW